MKLLGIDYGAKRVGIAISDDSGSMAFAKTVLQAGPELISEIKKMCEEEKIDMIVMGESKDYSGKDNEIMKEIYAVKGEIEKQTGLPIHLEPELMTSMEAQHIQGHNSMNDASAAAIILQSYLNRDANHSI